MKASPLFLENWQVSQRHWPMLGQLKNAHRAITIALALILITYSFLETNFAWVGSALAVIGILAIIDFRATWTPSVRDELIVIAATSSMFFLGTLVDQNVALYYNEAPTTHHLANFGIGLIVALLLFSRFLCSFLTMELNQSYDRLLDPTSPQALHILEMAHTHAQTLGSVEYSDESAEEKRPTQKYWIMMSSLGIGILVLAIFFFIAIVISLLLPLHPRLDEMANTIHPETFFFILIVFSVLTIFIIDRGLKKLSIDATSLPKNRQIDEEAELGKYPE
ncbi:MAG: hypothetical protein ACXAEI_01295 [Candidatus Hodarchaeales archaeon]|jgi:uncharacterized membrane protein